MPNKNCKKKCCCCCCKPKPPPPKPNLCDVVVSTYELANKTGKLGNLKEYNTINLNFKLLTGDDIFKKYFYYNNNMILKSIYTFSIVTNYNYFFEYKYNVGLSRGISINSSITIIAKEMLINGVSNINIPGSYGTQNTISVIKANENLTPSSLNLNTLTFNLGGAPGNNTIDYIFSNDIFSFGVNIVPLTLTTLYQISDKIVNKDQKQQIPLYDTTRTQTINQKNINSVTNNGFYYIDNNNFNILATTYSVRYSFTGVFNFNIAPTSVFPLVNYTITIYALIDNTNLIIIGTKTFKNPNNDPTKFVVVVDINADLTTYLGNNSSHTINLYWQFTNTAQGSIAPLLSIVNTDKSYFDFRVDNTALCNV